MVRKSSPDGFLSSYIDHASHHHSEHGDVSRYSMPISAPNEYLCCTLHDFLIQLCSLYPVTIGFSQACDSAQATSKKSDNQTCHGKYNPAELCCHNSSHYTWCMWWVIYLTLKESELIWGVPEELHSTEWCSSRSLSSTVKYGSNKIVSLHFLQRLLEVVELSGMSCVYLLLLCIVSAYFIKNAEEM